MNLKTHNATFATKITLCICYITALSSVNVLIYYTKNVKNYEYDPAINVLVTEFFKMLITSVFLFQEYKEKGAISFSSKHSILFAVPALAYCIINNLHFYAVAESDAATVQVLGNLRVLMVALVYLFAFKKAVLKEQWTAMALLVFGVSLTQISDSFHFEMNFWGFVLVNISNILSSLTGVYTEMLLKNVNESIHQQNFQLYGFGLLLNYMLHLASRSPSGDPAVEEQGMFHGFTPAVWLIALMQGLMGLLISFLMKYADNIVKIYCAAVATITTGVCSAFFFGMDLNATFFIGVGVVTWSVRMYSLSGPKAAQPNAATSSSSSLNGGEHTVEMKQRRRKASDSDQDPLLPVASPHPHTTGSGSAEVVVAGAHPHPHMAVSTRVDRSYSDSKKFTPPAPVSPRPE